MITRRSLLGLFLTAPFVRPPKTVVGVDLATGPSKTVVSTRALAHCGWTAPRTWVAGELVTAAQWNQLIRDNMENL